MTELRAVSSFTKYADNISADAISKQEKLAVLAARNGYESYRGNYLIVLAWK